MRSVYAISGLLMKKPRTIELMDMFLEEQGYANDFSCGRMHHEIYLSDVRRVPQGKMEDCGPASGEGNFAYIKN